MPLSRIQILPPGGLARPLLVAFALCQVAASSTGYDGAAEAAPEAGLDFYSPLPATTSTAHDRPHRLDRRQTPAERGTHSAWRHLRRAGEDNCPEDHFGCRNLGSENLCCPNGHRCSRDRSGNVGCCPIGAFCSGLVSEPGQTSSPPESTSTTDDGGEQESSRETESIVPGVTVTPPVQPIVDNSYFPFPYIATTYDDGSMCSGAWSACQTNSALCLGYLAGDGSGRQEGSWGGVTIKAPNGGITLMGGGSFFATGLPTPEASEICSSLSREACHGLELPTCEASEGDEGGFVIGNSAAWGLLRPGMASIGVGVLVGIGRVLF